MRRRTALARWTLLGLGWLGAASGAWAQAVALSGLSAGRALLAVDGGAPRFVAAGQTHAGVRVLAVGSDHALVEVQGERRILRLGDGPLAAQSPSAPRAITLLADGGGHFTSPGQINGQPAQFLVDTGATVLTLSEAQARRIGLNFGAGPKVRVKTANGELIGHQVSLQSVQLGGHTSFGVAAVVLPAELPYVLLGNSYLSRFALRREDGRMTLEPRY
ncbi:TIGR02281 family clan AA aspartic protease [Aquabacterium sp. A08]|uniref:retropepsin-like aspartic protease family protein n=1 Tax=Aquabacterium sp. A08 TaxID=2718532 RepID=UPI001422F461|nr:TIGR02281 family clan AA aspartic protease [Aquabacterium sp. A08]NIC40127.1 TIGR02281 family clan AA aspartic protease [Aquabacterium sp. A08]